MTEATEALGPSSYLPHAGKRAPEKVEDTLGNDTSLYMKDGLPYHVCKGYLVPCYFPEEYNEKGPKEPPSAKQEVKRHKILFEKLRDRYFSFVERGDPRDPRTPTTKEGLDYILAQYEDEKKAEQSAGEGTPEANEAKMRKERWGSLYVGSLVNRAEVLAATVYKQKQALGEETPDNPPDKYSISREEQELQSIIKIFINPENEFLKCVRLAGNRQDTDDIVVELLSEVGKAVQTKNGDVAWETRLLKENHVSKIADAMKMMDKTHDFMGQLLDSAVTTPQTTSQMLMPLKEALREFTDAARARVAIDADHDRTTYFHAEVDYKTARRKVDTIIDHLQTAHGYNPALASTLEQVSEGRRLIDDMCFYRRDFENAFVAYKGKCTMPTSKVLSDGSTVTPAYDHENNLFTPI